MAAYARQSDVQLAEEKKAGMNRRRMDGAECKRERQASEASQRYECWFVQEEEARICRVLTRVVWERREM